MRILKLITLLSITCLLGCKKENVNNPVHSNTHQQVFSHEDINGRSYKNDGLDGYYTRGVHSIEELDRLRSDASSPVSLLTDQAYREFREELLFYKGVVVSWRYTELAQEIRGRDYINFYRQVFGINPEFMGEADGYPAYTCLNGKKWDGKSPIEAGPKGCIDRPDCTCCWIRHYDIDNAIK
ncbi:MAG: hypothetical protein NZM35_12340 [Chitinophagales bacterium]|nr:hypothetical protein [Chitinophagales bacterium]MDW8420206.1 hypothetical protein [Chitinophagales bacterium]